MDVRVLQVAVANGRIAVERELRKFLKVRNATEFNTGVGYLYYGSITGTLLGVWGIDFWLRSETGYGVQVSRLGPHIPIKTFEGYPLQYPRSGVVGGRKTLDMLSGTSLQMSTHFTFYHLFLH